MPLALDTVIAKKPRTGRHDSQVRTLEELHRRFGFTPINIVETGTIRSPRRDFMMGDGWGTLTWKLWADATDSRVWTCDLDARAIELCRTLTQNAPNIEYVVSDSVEFLERFDRTIHLLFLDSFDTGPPGSPAVAPACRHQRREIEAAWPKLHEDALVLLDDIPPDFKNGKGELSIPFIEEKGWKLISYRDTQALFARRELG